MDDKINDLIALLAICHSKTNLFLLSEEEILSLLQELVYYQVTKQMVQEVLNRIELFENETIVELEEDFYPGY